MKKLLSGFATLAMMNSCGATVISCDNDGVSDTIKQKNFKTFEDEFGLVHWYSTEDVINFKNALETEQEKRTVDQNKILSNSFSNCFSEIFSSDKKYMNIDNSWTKYMSAPLFYDKGAYHSEAFGVWFDHEKAGFIPWLMQNEEELETIGKLLLPVDGATVDNAPKQTMQVTFNQENDMTLKNGEGVTLFYDKLENHKMSELFYYGIVNVSFKVLVLNN